MTIPFVSSLNFVPLDSLASGLGAPNAGALGVLSMYPYQPLISPTGSTTANYTIWVHFEDVELIGPAQPQSGRVFSSSKGKSASEVEQSSVGMGPLSSPLMRLSRAASMLTSVPGIRDYATGVSWYADLLSRTASIFGWSKPLNLSTPCRVIREVMPWFSNIDAPDSSLPLSLMVKNQVGVMPGFSGTDVDEMDFSFLITIPAFLGNFPWAESALSGAVLFSVNVTPQGVVNTFTTGSGLTASNFTPMQLISNYFTNWRGSMVYTIKIVKTEFHSGRLSFVFFPNNTYSTSFAPSSYALSNYVHKEVIDVRLCNEVTFVIPYISTSPWMSVGPNQNRLTGNFVCFVVDPLVAPASVNASINLIVEQSGGPDMEFAIPASNPITPYLNAVPQSGNVFNDPEPQRDDCELVSGTLGAATVKTDNGISGLACVGESVTSFRTLLKQTNIKPWFTSLPLPGTYFNVLPFATSAVVASGATDNTPTVVSDLYGVLSSCYCFARGGVRLKFLDVLTTAVNLPVVSYLEPLPIGSTVATSPAFLGTASYNGTTSFAQRTSSPQVYHNFTNNLACELQVPQYHKWHSRVCSDHIASSSLLANYSFVQGSLVTRLNVVHHWSSGTASSTLCRAASDDTNFGLFISVPPMIVTQGVGTQ